MDFLHRKREWRRTTILMYGLAAFLAGLGVARTRLTINASLVILGLAFVLVSLRRPRAVTAICLSIFGLFFGWWRGNLYMAHLDNYKPLYGQKITVTGTASTDGIYGTNSQLSFDLENLHVTKPAAQELVGKIAVKGYGEAAVYRGDRIEVSGKLYKTRGSRQGGISYATLRVQSRSTSLIEKVRLKFQAGMLSALPEPLASFALGLLVGQRNTLPQSTSDQLSDVGLTHIVAVSGYNLTIIMSAVYIVLKKRSKYQSTVLSLVLIGLFLLFTGFSPSIVRAAIVSSLGIVAAFYGRKFRPLLLLLLAAALTAGWYPVYIWSDIGWYLSFVAFFGVLILAPLFVRRFYKRKQPRLVANVVIETLSAQIMALPLIMYIFGEISIVSLPANVLVVPLVPLAMAASFVAGLAGMLAPFVAGWFAWPAWALLTYMLDVVNLMSRIPNALAAKSLSIAQLLGCYVVVILVALALWGKVKTKNGTITPKKRETVSRYAGIRTT